MPQAPANLRTTPDAVPGAATRMPRDASDTGGQLNLKQGRRRSKNALAALRIFGSPW
jgi:hypothetical protein